MILASIQSRQCTYITSNIDCRSNRMQINNKRFDWIIKYVSRLSKVYK